MPLQDTNKETNRVALFSRIQNDTENTLSHLHINGCRRRLFFPLLAVNFEVFPKWKFPRLLLRCLVHFAAMPLEGEFNSVALHCTATWVVSLIACVPGLRDAFECSTADKCCPRGLRMQMMSLFNSLLWVGLQLMAIFILD